MSKFTLSLTVAFGLFMFPSMLSAQTDSLRFDAGNVFLNRNFTQSITIRGEDLEKMPFLSLSDALAVWLVGTYTGPGELVYVVDGNPVTDVNLYPIYDIAEVTFIENAVAGAAYGNGVQELVSITTKRTKGKDGFRVAAQTGLIKGGQFQGPTHTGYYHQYYLGAQHNGDKWSYGFSADWQQDEVASLTSASLSEYTPPLLRRWRLNGRLEWRPDAKNLVRLTLGYASQGVGYSLNSPGGGYQYHYSDWWYNRMLVPELSWEGHWSHGLRNKFAAGYLYGWSRLRYDETDTVDNSGTTAVESGYSQSTGKAYHLVLRDRLSYDVKAGNWMVVPVMDLSYQRIDERSAYAQFNPFLNPTSTYKSDLEEKGNLFYITPSVDMSLGRTLDIGAGVAVNASGKAGSANRRFFPFITAGLDLLHIGPAATGNSLKLFSSYARRPLVYLTDYGLGDLVTTGKSYGNSSLYMLYYDANGYAYSNGVQISISPLAGPEPGYWTWVTGAAFKTPGDRVSLQYSYERRNLSFDVLVDNNTKLGFMSWVETLHHADVRFKVIDTKKAGWMTGLNASLMHSNGDTTGFQQFGINLSSAFGDLNGAGDSWTGGWVNRMRVGNFSAGVDVLYHFGETVPVYNFAGAQIGVSRNNSVLVPNVYAGYRWNLGDRVLELFVEGRGLWGNKDSDLPDVRRFYTVGGTYAW